MAMTEQIGFALLTFSSLLAMVDPLAAIPVFISTTGRHTPEERAGVLRRAILTAFCILTGFGLLGTWIFDLFGITTEAFRIAGGILLFGVGLDMLQARRSRTKATAEEEEEERDDPGIVPLGMPMLAGPGAITTVVALLAQAPSIPARFVVYGSIVAVLLISWLVLRVAPLVAQRLGTTGMHVIERIMGLIVMVVGVQFVLDGLRDAILALWARMQGG